MSSAFCSLDEAFAGPAAKTKHKKSSSRTSAGKEHFVPGPLAGSPTSDSIPEPMGPPSSAMGKPDANGAALQEFFPLPGESAEPDEWAKAFTLEGSQMPQIMRPDGPTPYGAVGTPVAGKSTLWRSQNGSQAAPYPGPSTILPSSWSTPSDIQHRLDTLTKQLEALTTVTPMQSTAELFLFVAIGLLFLLAMDTLLRCATSVALSKAGTVQSGGSSSSSSRYSIGRRGRF